MSIFRDHTSRDWLVLLAIIVAGAWARLTHLERVGVRTVDEGSYCFFALAMLNGDPGCIQDKPGQALILATGFALLGRTQYAAVMVTAFIGLLTIPVLYWAGMRIRGKTAAVILAAESAFLPYFLYYNRSAASDSNFVFFCFLALGLFLFALGKDTPQPDEGRPGDTAEPGNDDRISLRWLSVSGIAWGLAATVNLAALPPFGVTWLFLGLHCRWQAVPLKRTAKSMALLAGGLIAGVIVVEAPLLYFVDWEKVWAQFFGHAGHIGETQLRWEWALHLWKFCGPLPLALAVTGLLLARKWWRTPVAVFPLLSVILIAFYARAALSLPRLHLPLLLGLLPLTGLGGAWLFEQLWSRVKGPPPLVTSVAISILLLGINFPEARRIMTVESGYPSACSWLGQHMDDQESGVATHTWWTLMSFTGRQFSYNGYTGPDGRRRGIAEALNSADWRASLTEELRGYAERGYAYLVLDYLLFTRLVQHWADIKGEGPTPAGVENWRSFVREFPPEDSGGTTVANPAAADYQTRAEDAYIPPLEGDPLGQSIYIYRIRELLGALAGRAVD